MLSALQNPAAPVPLCSPPEVHMEQTEEPGRMPLNAGGDTGYGSLAGPGLSGILGGESESAPLLIPVPEPEPEPEPFQQWQPLSKEELEVAAGGPGWRKARCYLVLLFWLAWLAMLAVSVTIVAMSPRPVVTPLRWWQKTLFYQLQPDLQAEGSEGVNALCEQLPYLRSLGIGALILEASPLNLNATGEGFGTLPQIQHLLAESNIAGLKVVLDVCELGPQDGEANETSTLSATVHNALRFWLQQGAAGFAICDTDAAYSEKTLLEWKGVFKEFSREEEEERIVVVKQTRDVLPHLKNQSNVTLVDVVMRSILPSSQHLLSAKEVAEAIETRLQTREEDTWPSWTVVGNASQDLKKLLLVLVMTLPGSPVVQYDKDIDQRQNVSLNVGSSHGDGNEPSDTNTDEEKKKKRLAVALFTSLSHSRAREEALLFGSFTFLPFNSSTNSSSSSSSSNSTLPSPSSSPPILAFLRSWGCVHFLILLNVGPEPHALDPAWAPSLPKAGVFVTNTGMDRLGSTTLDALELRPHEAVVIKLFEAGSYS